MHLKFWASHAKFENFTYRGQSCTDRQFARQAPSDRIVNFGKFNVLSLWGKSHGRVIYLVPHLPGPRRLGVLAPLSTALSKGKMPFVHGIDQYLVGREDGRGVFPT